MDTKFNQSTLIDIKKIVNENQEKWINYNLSEVNDCIIRLGIVEGEFHWHKHDEEDEFFLVLEGKLFLDLESETIELSQWQGYTVPKQVVHRTRAPKKTVMLMIEKSSVNPRGD
ncbi:MAG: cupin domain-containing protein [Candidatus Thorarchaeota archaeon]